MEQRRLGTVQVLGDLPSLRRPWFARSRAEFARRTRAFAPARRGSGRSAALETARAHDARRIRRLADQTRLLQSAPSRSSLRRA